MTNTIIPAIRHTPLTVKFTVNTCVPILDEALNNLEEFLSKNDILKSIDRHNREKLQEHGELSVDHTSSEHSELIIHLVRKNAIVFVLLNFCGQPIIDKIRVDVGLLLYGDSECPVNESDIIAAHSIVIEIVSAFVADPSWDPFCIFPMNWNWEEHFIDYDESHYKKLEVSIIVPGVNVENLHFPSDSRIRPMRLSDNSIVWIDGDNEIRFGNVSSVGGWGSILKPEGADDQSTRLTLITRYPVFLEVFFDESLLFGLRHANVATRFHDLASSLEVVHIPSSTGDRRDDDVSMGSHAIAMDMALDGRLMDYIERTLNPKPLVLDELRRAVRSLTAQCNPISWAELLERAYAWQAQRAIHTSDWKLHPYVKGVVS